MDNYKTWKTIALVTMTIAVILVGVIAFMSRHISYSNIRPQTFKTIPDDMLADMEEIVLNSSGAGDGSYSVTRYENGYGGWLEIGIDTGKIDECYIPKGYKQIDNAQVDMYIRDCATLLLYQIDSVNYYVRGSLPDADLSDLMAGYIDIISNKRLT